MSAVTLTEAHTKDGRIAVARAAVEQVCDPEIPVLTIADLGVLRSIEAVADGALEVTITPTYSGCPAMDVIGFEVKAALMKAGIHNARVRKVLSPAWTTDWMTREAKDKLKAYGIAPPGYSSNNKNNKKLFADPVMVQCPLCNSFNTTIISEFGSTSCKSLYKCEDCKEPFDHFKCH